jgi:predicted nucleotidyltransferase
MGRDDGSADLPRSYDIAMQGADMNAVKTAIAIDEDAISNFCRKWRVSELSLFGSVLRPEEFREDSDVDVMVTWEKEARWTLFDFVDMQDELTELFGRRVDLLSKRALKNPFRRHSILSTAQVLYGEVRELS